MDDKSDSLVIRGSEASGKTELIISDRRAVHVYRNRKYNNLWNGVDDNRIDSDGEIHQPGITNLKNLQWICAN